MAHILPVASKDHKVIRSINWFLGGPYYIALVSFLTLLSAVFSLEIPLYFLYIAAGIYICLFADDLLGLMPIVLSAYMSVSEKNNPGNHQSTIFSPDRWGIALIALVAVLVIFVVVRVITDKNWGGKQFFTKKRKLTPSIIVLGIAYCLGGICAPPIIRHSILFGAMQFCTIFIPYFLFSGGVNWQNCRRDYFGWIGFCTGFMLLVQLANIYRINDVIVNGIIDRDRIYNGWSMYNNLGIMLAMMIPSAFYLASRHHKGWLGSIAASMFMVGTALTCSRNSIMMGCAVFILCVFVSLAFAKNKKANFWVVLIFSVCAILACVLFYRKILQLFTALLDIGTDNNSRFMTYREGLKQFVKHPIFGGSFSPRYWLPFDWSSVDSFSNFFPPRWHNTIVQLLASCGVVGLAAYLYHRGKTVTIFLHDRTREKAFIACMILTLLGGSMLDCHFFNIGPVLYYSAGLAFAEFCVKK